VKYSVFYSWQSDLPNNTNRGFIDEALKGAINQLSSEGTLELEPSIDRDTQGVPGAPNISATILEKIRSSDAFVADISIVTGSPSGGGRAHPNPNVLIELGYAIATLGWERVILVCNEQYGSDSDLPFDVRQHRRINYTVRHDEPKAGAKKLLTGQLKTRIGELLAFGRALKRTKSPALSVSWKVVAPDRTLMNPWSLDLSKAQHVSEHVVDKVKSELESIDEVDGRIDPDWQSKLSKYKSKARQFLDAMKQEELRHAFLLNANKGKAVQLTILVENAGTSHATDVRVKLLFPSWIHIFKRFPQIEPSWPTLPTPVAPVTHAKSTSFALGAGNPFSAIDRLNDMVRLNNSTAGCELEGERTLTFWADRLLHKHDIFVLDDSYYILADPDAPSGEFIVKCQTFCSEFESWQSCELVLNIS
jgi:hypothetical protein